MMIKWNQNHCKHYYCLFIDKFNRMKLNSAKYFNSQSTLNKYQT